ncbi:unnamed protein product [Pseudo-nitzschia multistriata]|uniref:Uncharacterized protein n=1 Tax=Pseudo-nitzschia multistriata TaxID=183589 RepID=A0A448YW93_9STRA|nr:unnamed protein product [Pseudo-nitzschia multistriata]
MFFAKRWLPAVLAVDLVSRSLSLVGRTAAPGCIRAFPQPTQTTPLGASVLDLFRVLEEEEEEASKNKKNSRSKAGAALEMREPKPFRMEFEEEYGEDEEVFEMTDEDNEDEDSNEGYQENENENENDNDNDGNDEYVVSDAEALLACWSFLKRRKKIGQWNEHEERKAQKALSRNYFLTDEEVGEELLSEIMFDEDDDDEEDDDQTSRSDKETDNDEDATDSDVYGGDAFASMATVQDLLSASNPLDEDHGVVGDIDDYGVSTDLKFLSDLVANKASTEGSGTKTRGGRANDDIDLSHTEFTSFPTEPSETRLRRVDAMKKRWEDPSYREKWYQTRWGGDRKRKRESQSLRERTAIQRARELPSGFLGSDELASMTEEDIADAIRDRVESTRKRVANRKETIEGRRDTLEAQMKALLRAAAEEAEAGVGNDESELRGLSRDALFDTDPKELEEAKRKRSERAKKLYATRRKNQEARKNTERAEKEEASSLSSLPRSPSSLQKKTSPRGKGPYYPPKQRTPRDAFLRIENDLDRGAAPSEDDVRLVLVPGKMKNRKPLLGRILRDEFGLRGKCVPPIASEDSEEDDNFGDLEFVQRCTIERLGAFILCLLKKDKKSGKDNAIVT